MEINTEKINSSAIAEIGYNLEKKELNVMFNSGSKYVYKDVPEDTFKQFINSESKGQFFIENIKYNYSYEKLT